MGKQPAIQAPAAPAPPPQMPTEPKLEETADRAAQEAAEREKKNIGRRQTILTSEKARKEEPETQSLGIMGGK